MTTQEMIEHNRRVVKNVINALVDAKLADPFELMVNPQYAAENFWQYVEAANITRDIMGMPRLVIYKIMTEDE